MKPAVTILSLAEKAYEQLSSIPIITATNRVSGWVAERLTGKSWHTSFMSKDKQKREKKKPKKGKLSSK
jgi:hypothetical protein